MTPPSLSFAALLRRAGALGLAAALAIPAASQPAPPPAPGALPPRAGAGLAALQEKIEVRRDVPYAPTGNPRHTLHLLLPRAEAAAPRPLLVFIHGGGWRAGSKDGGMAQLARPVAEGRVVGASLGYRLTDEASWPAQGHDVKAGLRWLRAHAAEFGADPDRIVVMGSSAGGHLASFLGTTGDDPALEGEIGAHAGVSTRVQGVIDLFGPADLSAMARQPGGMDHASAGSPEGRLIGGPVEERAALAAQASPLRHVSPDDPPFLILHGDGDRTVPYAQSIALRDALRDAGVPVALVTVTGGGHGQGFPADLLRPLQDAFLDAVFAGRAPSLEDQAVPASIAGSPPPRPRP